DGERASVNREIPAESARNGEIPKFQKPLFGTTPPSALSGLVVQTFPRRSLSFVKSIVAPKSTATCPASFDPARFTLNLPPFLLMHDRQLPAD
ncbi:hypothetical protein, partial [Xanthomonas sp. D-36-1]|uniref:hypothetical protein n=1 Tax=Xanthomonas sp. D-36-1 TaxID=2821271 RepID=UPI0031F31079